MDTYVLLQEIPDSQEDAKSNDEEMLNGEEWEKIGDETLNKQIEEVSAVIVRIMLGTVETMKRWGNERKEEKSGASK